ncbi:MAG: HNH endonuclease [Archangium sp.]|nr:HNH endonuclease [Archangium sp.]
MAGVNLSTLNVAFSHSDFEVPLMDGALGFRRNYNNMLNTAGALGVGWSHNFEMTLQEESITGASAVRYTAIIDGQAYGFPECTWPAVSPSTGSTCTKTDGLHGATLRRYESGGAEAFVLTQTDGTRYLFRTPVPVKRELQGNCGPLKAQAWLIDAYETGHGADLGVTASAWVTSAPGANWITVKYVPGTIRVDEVTRVGSKLQLAFAYQPFAPANPTHERGGLQQLQRVTLQDVSTTVAGVVFPSNLYRVDFKQDDRHNLTKATVTATALTAAVPFGWKYTYPTNEKNQALMNELERADFFTGPATDELNQSTVKYARPTSSTIPPPYPWLKEGETVSEATRPGQSGKPISLTWTGATRVLGWPDGTSSQILLNPDGALLSSTRGTSKLTMTWDPQDGPKGLIPNSPAQDATSVKLQTLFDVRQRPTGFELGGAHPQAIATAQPTLPQTAVTTISSIDERFGIPLQTKLHRAGGDVTIATAVSPTGDVESITIGPYSVLSGAVYDANGTLQSWTDEYGRNVTATDPHPLFGLPRKLTYTLPGATTGLSGFERQLEYDEVGRLKSSSTLANGLTWHLETTQLDSVGRPLSLRSGVGHGSAPATEYSYDYQPRAGGLRIIEECPATNGKVTTEIEDGLPLSRETTVSAGSASSAAVTQSEEWKYDGGLLVEFVDVRGKTHLPSYTPGEAFLTGVKTGAITEQQVTPDKEGRPISGRDAFGAANAAIVDAVGRKVGSNFTRGQTSYRELDVTGAPVKIHDGPRTVNTSVDAWGNINHITGGNGLDIQVTYDAAKRLKSRTTDLGLTEEYDYNDALGRVTEIRRHNGNQWVVIRRAYSDNFDHNNPAPGITTIVEEKAFTGIDPHTEVRTTTIDARGLLLSSTEDVTGQTASQTTRYSYDPNGRLLLIQWPDARTTQFSYDAAGRLETRIDEEGKQTAYTYEGDRLKTVDSPHADSLVTLEYDDSGRLKKRTEKRASGQPDAVTNYAYLPNGVIQTTDAVGNVSQRTLLGSGQVAHETVTLTSGTFEVDRTWEGNALKQEVRTEGSWSATSVFDYSARGRLERSFESFSAPGRSWTATDSHVWAGNRNTITHTWTMGTLPAGLDPLLTPNVDVIQDVIDVDALGLPVRHERGALIDQFVNDAEGRQVQQHPSNSAMSLLKYGSDGRLESLVFGPDPETTLWKYDPRGRVRRIEAPDGVTELALDGRGLELSRTYRGFTTSATWDDEGNPKTRTVGTSETRFKYGPQGELLSTTLPDSTVWSYEYDALARLKKVTPPAGPLLEQFWDYDALGRVKSHVDGAKTWTTLWSDGVGATSLPDGMGTLTTLSDSRGRVLSVSASGGATPSVATYSSFYDGLDTLRFAHEAAAPGASRGSASSTYARDASLRLTGVARNGDRVTYGFDGASARVQSRTHAGVTVTSGYDPNNRLSSLTGPWGTTSVGWEGGGQRLSFLADLDLLVTEGFCYNTEGRVATIRSSTDCVNGPVVRSYQYDGRGNPIVESDGILERRFDYDANDRLIASQEWSSASTAWSLHADGSRAGEKQFPPGTWPVSFTQAGHTMERQYDYDGLTGALSSVVDVTAPSTPVTVAHWGYDGAGRVTSRTVSGVSTAPTWDAFSRMTSAGGLVFEYDQMGMRRSAIGVGLPARQFTYVGESLVAENGVPHVGVGPYAVAQGDVRFAHDALGSVINQVSATASSSATFSVLGKQSGGPQLTSVGFTGYLEEPVAGAKYAKQRWADDEFGIFLSRDSIGADSYLSSPNALGPWSYANLSPARFTDPDGRQVPDDAFVAVQNMQYCQQRHGADAPVVELCMQALARPVACSPETCSKPERFFNSAIGSTSTMVRGPLNAYVYFGGSALKGFSGGMLPIWQWDDSWSPYLITYDEEARKNSALTGAVRQTITQGPSITAAKAIEGTINGIAQPIVAGFEACTSTSVMAPEACGAAAPRAAIAAWGGYGLSRSLAGLGSGLTGIGGPPSLSGLSGETLATTAIGIPSLESQGAVVAAMTVTSGFGSFGECDWLDDLEETELLGNTPPKLVAGLEDFPDWTPVRNGRGINFATSPYLYKGAGQKAIVRIQYSGSRDADFGLANVKANIGNTQTPPTGYTWHHLDDYNPITNEGTMQLVLTAAHKAWGHWGGVEQFQRANCQRYK